MILQDLWCNLITFKMRIQSLKCALASKSTKGAAFKARMNLKPKEEIESPKEDDDEESEDEVLNNNKGVGKNKGTVFEVL